MLSSLPRPLIGIGLKLASTMVFAMMVALVKLTGGRLPTTEVVFFRNAFALLPVFLMVWSMGHLGDLATGRPLIHVTRALSGVAAMTLWFASLQRMHIAEAQAIVFAAPILVVVLSALILRETVRIYRWSAVIVGFVGVVIMLSPHIDAARMLAGDDRSIGALMALGSALFMALAVIQVRSLVKTEKTGAIVLYFSLLATLLSGAILPFNWVTPSAYDATLLVAAGFLGGLGQILFTQSFRYADASVIAPIEYMSLIWIVILGYILFGDLPEPTMWIGAPFVISAGVFIAWRERKRSPVAPPPDIRTP